MGYSTIEEGMWTDAFHHRNDTTQITTTTNAQGGWVLDGCTGELIKDLVYKDKIARALDHRYYAKNSKLYRR